MFVDYGYYIISPCPCPAFLAGFSERILTVSGCFCEIWSELFSCMGADEREDEIFRKQLGFTESEFLEYSAEITRLFEDGRLDTDGRFLFKADGEHVYRRYFYRQTQSEREESRRLVGISLEETSISLLAEEMGTQTGAPEGGAFKKQPQTGGLFLGFDILGWDISGFHTYLCNSLQKNLMESFDLKPGEFGLLKNSLEEVGKFAAAIQGRGEPVVWIPFALHDYTPV